MTSSILPLAKGSRPRRPWPTGSAQCAALVCVLLINALVADNFFAIHIQDGRLFGSLIDILNRCAPVALLALGMTLVIATGGIDLSVGAVMAISGATMTSLATGGHSLPVIFASIIGVGLLCGLWNGLLVAVFKIQPIVATLILMVAGRGIAQLITEGQIITFNNEALAWISSGALFYLPTPVIITLGMALLLWLLTKRTALGLFIEAVGINIKAAKNAGLWLEMDAILAVVIGGTSLMGGASTSPSPWSAY
jgi:ribose/xylose/arabinose/galactoside ABC-type transport system permease subunit